VSMSRGLKEVLSFCRYMYTTYYCNIKLQYSDRKTYARKKQAQKNLEKHYLSSPFSCLRVLS
jgi:hypothetical protein